MSDPLNTDLTLTWHGLEAQARAQSTGGADASVGGGDLRLTQGRENLSQAIANRLYTRRGALGRLGHPGYGSRLHTLIGEPDTPRTRALAEFYIREALGQEPRVLRVVDVALEPPSRVAGMRETLAARVTVIPAGDREPLTVSIRTRVGG